MLSRFKFPENDSDYYWTLHSKSKMLQYRISGQKIKLVLNNPTRVESGIAPKTSAVMKRNDTLKRKEEIWVMYQLIMTDNRQQMTSDKRAGKKKRTVIISVWRYPGISKKRELTVPEDTLAALEEIKKEISGKFG